MGASDSRYIQEQEKFVNANVEVYKRALPDRYSTLQIKGKLRQLYYNTDLRCENRDSYILDNEWRKAKAVVLSRR